MVTDQHYLVLTLGSGCGVCCTRVSAPGWADLPGGQWTPGLKQPQSASSFLPFPFLGQEMKVQNKEMTLLASAQHAGSRAGARLWTKDCALSSKTQYLGKSSV